jgi:hypothetical protein
MVGSASEVGTFASVENPVAAGGLEEQRARQGAPRTERRADDHDSLDPAGTLSAS